MAKQLNVSLAFTADTREAKAQLQDLQRQLNNILKTPSNKLGITDEIREAISATAELSSRLQQATNVNTGNLDFSKFNNSLKQSGQSLSSYGQQLQKLGPTGQQAFLTLTKSIATAEIPIKRTNALVKEFTTTLANTARWQVSSSVLHGLMGSMQSAYRYAQDLNESLNDIRIVTGQSVDQMARFAAEANAAAKALSATTVEYTNASLIYYQQGLSDQQVKDRTNITIKMANVSKQSAEVVSEQMTAVWNNFYNGSKSLEYYADVMTALGAATASSADEIAGGLEKFAAIGDTIGLSYEYAAAALATITSNTRQSEEVVGTALKTIFARIQGLNLGETLDDGTTLNKYSSALEKVGISIFDSAGELKRMDDILNEMGAKWETLNKAQQTALAQTVAGTRQYTQLVALMDNWNKGDSDSMKANLSTAYGSSGALQEQADIYAESWEAARDRVTAAAEKIYNALLNDDFFIDMLNGFEKILTFVNQLVDNLGGLQGVLLALGAIVTKVFSAQLSQGLTNMAYNIKMITKSGRESVEKERRDFIENAVNSIPQSDEYTTDVEIAQQDSLRTELTLQAEYMDNAERMSSIEAETNKKLIERTKLLREQTVELQKQKESIDTRVSNGVMDLRTDISAFNMANRKTGEALDYNEDIQPEINNIKAAATVQAELTNLNTTIELLSKNSDQGKIALEQIKKSLLGLDTDADKDIARLVEEINKMGDSPDPEQLRQKLEALNIELEESIKISSQKIKDVVSPEAGKKVDALTQDLREQAQAVRDVRVANQEAKQSQEDTSKSIAGATGAQKQWSDVMVESANVAFNVASAISMVNSAIDQLKDPDVSGMQKLVTVLSTMGMVLPTIISLIGTMKKLFSSETVAKIANAAATWAQVAAEKKHNEVKDQGLKLTKENIKQTWKDTTQKIGQKGKNLKDSWNNSALEKDKSFTKLDNGSYYRQGDPKNMTWSKNAAASEAGAKAAKALGSKVATAGIAAAGIALIIGTVAMVVNQLNKAEKAVEKAKAAAQSLSENYDNVKASYDNFINAQSGYETATASMEELTRGTVAYQEALMQANEAAGELLATNKNLKYTVEDGKIVIDKDSLEQAKADELKRVETAQAAKMAGQRELNAAELNLNKRDMARNLKSDADKSQKGWNAGIGGVLGAAGAGLAAGGIAGLVTGSVTGPGALITAAIGASIGLISGIVTGIVQETSTDTETEAIDLLAQQAEKDESLLARLKAGEVSADELKTIGIEDEALIASLQKNGEEVAALVGEMQANTAAINAQNDLVASNSLANNEAVQNSEYRDQIIDIAGDAYGHAYDKAMESDWVDDWGKDGIAKINGANKEAEKVFKEYLKYAGLEGQGYELTDTTGTDKNREFVYKDKDGNEHTVSLEAMQAARAAYEASSTLDDSATKLAETFDNLANSSNEADQALLSFVSGKNFEGASKGELEDIQSEVGDIGYNAKTGEYDSSKVKTYLESSLGETLTNDVAIRYGYESADAMMDAFAKQLNNADTAWDNIKVPDNFKFAEDMSLGTAKALESQIEKMNLGPLGEQAGEEYVKALNSMLGQLDAEEQQKALNALTNIDWSDWNAIDQAQKIMKDFGVEIDISSQEWKDFIKNMRLANGAMPDFSQLKQDLNDVCSILDKLDFGSVISEEDYARLVAYNNEWERFFMLQADGSRQFIGNASDMKREIRDNISQQRQELEYRKEIQKGMKNANWKVGGKAVDWHESGDAFTYVGTAENLMKSGGDTQRVLEELGYTDAIIQEMVNDYNEAVTSGDEAVIAAAEERFKTMYDALGDFMEEDLDVVGAELDEMMASTATSLSELDNMWQNNIITSEDAYSKGIEMISNNMLHNAESLAELDAAMAEIEAHGGEVNPQEKADALLNLAASYDNCTQEMERYQAALNSGIESEIKNAEAVLRSSILIGDAAKQYDLSAESLEAQAQEIMIANNMTEEQAEQAARLAISNQRLNKGLTKLVKGWKDWKKELKSSDKTSQDYADTLVELSDAVQDLVGWYEDLNLNSKFVEDNMDLIEQAASGDMNAIIKLGAEVAKYSVSMAKLDTTLAEGKLKDGSANAFQSYMDSLEGVTNAADAFIAVQSDVTAGFDNIANNIAALQNGSMSLADVFGGEQGLQDWVNQLNAYASATGMTATEMQDMLSSVGVTANVQTDYQEQDVQVPVYEEHSRVVGQSNFAGYDSEGQMTTYNRPIIQRYTINKAPMKTKGYVGVASISMDGEGEAPGVSPPTFTGRQAPSSSAVSGGSKGGGGSSNSAPSTVEKRKPTKKSDVSERYKEVNDAIDNVTDALTRAEKASDRLWGKDKLDAMRQENKILQEQYKLLQDKAKEAEEYAKQDAANLRKVAEEANISFVIDQKTGDITNIESQMDILYQRLRQAEEQYNKDVEAYNKAIEKAEADGKISDSEAKNLEKMKEALDAYESGVLEKIENEITSVQDAVALYEESRELFEQLGIDMEDIQDQIMQNNYDIIMEGLEIPIALNEEDLRFIDLQLSKLEDDVYSMAEAVTFTSSKLDEYRDNLRLADEALSELNRAHEAGEITDAAYHDGLSAIRDQYYDNIEALIELDKQMKAYYGETLDAANEELSKYTDQMEHQTSVLEHYQTLLELMGKQNDYKMIGKVLQGQVETTKNQAEVSKQWYESRRADAEELKRQYEEAVAAGASTEELDLLKTNWQAAEVAANEAQEQMLSDAEAWAEALTALLENKLNELGQSLEDQLTGDWGSFDAMTTAMERANSLQEEYLTTTNQIYETNKLMRTAQQEIDKTTNSAAKKRLQAYINETQQLQDQSKLSQYELEIQQAKYDLLLAEIALEEAQDAKSTVRLQRDSEGNFGYVYTADSNKIAEAQQQLEDAQNELYNIGLEGANSYTEKYQQTMAEMYDTLRELQEQYQNKAFATEEEYQKAVTEATDYYYQKLKDFSSLYQVSLTTDSRVIADAWSSDFSEMTYQTEQWMSNIQDYNNQVIDAFRNWEQAMTGPDGVSSIVGSSLEDVADNITEITDKSKELTKTTKEKVIPALNDEIDTVANLTGKYANLRDTITEIIEQYGLMIGKINAGEENEYNGGGSGSGGTSDAGNSDNNSSSGDNNNSDGTTTSGADFSGTSIFSSGNPVRVKSSASNFSAKSGNVKMATWVPGSKFQVYQVAGNEVLIGDPARKGIFTGWVNADDLEALDTGGYTGQWGSYGKLAMLHEKELVLNAQDTANFLSSMEVLERILQIIDLQATSSQIGGMLYSPSVKDSSSVIEQSVHIEASFPAVQDRSEIEEAFNNLINKASQYANRK